MNLKTWVPLVVAGVLGTVAAKFALDLSGSSSAQQARPADALVGVVVAAREIAPGATVEAGDLRLVQMRPGEAPVGFVSDPAHLAGRVVQMHLGPGSPVVEAALAPSGAAGGVAALLARGMRAVTVRIDEFSGVAGFLAPGSSVDLLTTLGNNDNAHAVTVAQAVRVLAVGQRTTPGKPREPGENLTSVTLVVTPQQAEAIDLVAATSQLRLVLRPPGDVAKSRTEGVSVAQLRERLRETTTGWLKPVALAPSPATATTPVSVPINPAPTAPATRPSEPTYRTVRVIRGGVESEVRQPLPERSGRETLTSITADPTK